MAGGENIGFSNGTFLSERENADRNYALGYYMRENKCFPEKCDLMASLDLYFQVSAKLKEMSFFPVFFFQVIADLDEYKLHFLSFLLLHLHFVVPQNANKLHGN